MKRNLLRLAFLSLLAMPISSYGTGPIHQEGKSFEEVKERINAWLSKDLKDNDYNRWPWYKELVAYIKRNHDLAIPDSMFEKAQLYPVLWILRGLEIFEKLKGMKPDAVANGIGKKFPIFVDLINERYKKYVKFYVSLPFTSPGAKKLEEVYGEAIIRRLGDQIDKFVEEHPEEDRRSSGEE